MIINPKTLSYDKLSFLSKEQLDNHKSLYLGYVGKVNEIRKKYSDIEFSNGNPTYNEQRELKLEEGFALNGVKLHELYFENIDGDGNLSNKISELLIKNFKSVENWQQEFINLGLSSRGWVILAQNSDGSVENYICDMHNQGGIWQAEPLLVLDVYEHAYFTDYGIRRKDYIAGFIGNINWNIVEKRIH
jgi:Fe-Mn family superoxide dismutase